MWRLLLPTRTQSIRHRLTDHIESLQRLATAGIRCSRKLTDQGNDDHLDAALDEVPGRAGAVRRRPAIEQLLCAAEPVALHPTDHFWTGVSIAAPA